MAMRDLVEKVAESVLIDDDSEKKVTKVVTIKIGGGVAESLSDAQSRNALELVRTLAQLKELGYDQDSDVAKSIIQAAGKTQAVLGKMGDSLARSVD